MNLEELKLICLEIRSKQNHSRFRWPIEFRDHVLATSKSGFSTLNISRATEIPHMTIKSWVEPIKPVKSFIQVPVHETSRDIILTWKSGVEINGLTFEELQELLREELL